MARKILGVLVGYIALAAFVALTFMAAFTALGVDGAYAPGSYNPSGTWLVVSFVLGFAGAVVGGLVCVLIARSHGTAMVFAGIVLVLGFAIAIPALFSDAPTEERPPGVSITEAAGKARQPAWVALLNPFVGAAGILLGSRMRREVGE